MRNTNGQLICIEDHLVQTPYGLLITDLKKGQTLSYHQLKFLEDVSHAFDASKHLNLVNSSEKEFIELIRFKGADEFTHSLKMIHDFALYHSDLCFDTAEKNALFDLKILWEGLEEMAKA
ncbi:MAG: hypothetical protein ABJF04_18030 [Reichenbachiella sp.]|uniref:hypothetical protein n=1 Tax=Reichenbachiella sp. TaxID=2184521 RepID=UPI003266C173